MATYSPAHKRKKRKKRGVMMHKAWVQVLHTPIEQHPIAQLPHFMHPQQRSLLYWATAGAAAGAAAAVATLHWATTAGATTAGATTLIHDRLLHDRVLDKSCHWRGGSARCLCYCYAKHTYGEKCYY